MLNKYTVVLKKENTHSVALKQQSVTYNLFPGYMLSCLNISAGKFAAVAGKNLKVLT